MGGRGQNYTVVQLSREVKDMKDMKDMKDIQLYDEVEILNTGERAFVVDIDEAPGHDSYMLEIKGKNELPDFYKRKDFKFIKRD